MAKKHRVQIMVSAESYKALEDFRKKVLENDVTFSNWLYIQAMQTVKKRMDAMNKPAGGRPKKQDVDQNNDEDEEEEMVIDPEYPTQRIPKSTYERKYGMK